jgi:hypothetical protein
MISKQEALAIAKSLAVRSGHFWDDRTARVWWHEKKAPPQPCWAVMTGEEDKHWTEAFIGNIALVLLIDAQTGEFAGIDLGRSVLPAASVARDFEPRG